MAALNEFVAAEVDRQLRRRLAAMQIPILTQFAGTPVSAGHRALNFQGAGVSVTDDPVGRRATVTIPGGQFTGVATTTSFDSSASSKALSLWNGTSNNSPPTNWQTAAFNDSAWSAPADLGASTSITGAEILWVTTVPASATEEALFRQHFTVPTGVLQGATLTFQANDASDGIYINGTLIAGSIYSGAIGPVSVSVPVTLLVAGDNVLAMKGRNTLAQTPPISGDAQVIWRIDLTYQLTTSARGTRVYNASAETLGSGALVALLFNSERFDTDGMHSTSSNTTRLTVPTGLAGFYQIGACVEWAANASGVRGINVRLNGTTNIAIDQRVPTGGAVMVQTVNCYYQMNDGDYIELVGFQNSGGNLNVDSVGNYSPEFWMYRVG